MSKGRDVAGSGVTEHLTETKLGVLQIKTHIGLGDAFVLQGLVHTKLMEARYSRIIINTKKAYLPDLKLMYKHIGSLVDFQLHEDYKTVPSNREDASDIIATGFFTTSKTFNQDFCKAHWDREFYRQAGVPFINRWLHCYVPTLQTEPLKRRDFSIRHHDPARKFLIEGLKPDMDIVVGERERLLDWVPELMAAKEIHCIDSCVLNLVESMWHLRLIRSDATLLYHAYARQDPPATLLAPWKVLK